jgi:hypothetical protein
VDRDGQCRCLSTADKPGQAGRRCTQAKVLKEAASVHIEKYRKFIRHLVWKYQGIGCLSSIDANMNVILHESLSGISQLYVNDKRII